MDEILADPMQPVFVVDRSKGKLGGFLEAGIRKYAEGCDTSPVGYIEGWYVDEDLRDQGIWGSADKSRRRLGALTGSDRDGFRYLAG